MKNRSWEILFVAIIIIADLSLVFASDVVGINIDDDEVDVGETVGVNILLNSDIYVSKITVDYDDDSDDYVLKWDGDPYHLDGDNIFSIDADHKYEEEGKYKIEVTVKLFDGTILTESSEEITVESDNLPPEVSLISPKGGTVISQNSVSFKFSAEDDNELDECVLKLYNYTSGDLEYSKSFTDFDDSDSYTYSLTEFEDGYYSWTVSCEDDDGEDETTSKGLFKIDTVLYDEEDDVNGAIDDIESFLKNKNSLGSDEKSVLEYLGIFDELNYYKTELEDIDRTSANRGKLSDESEFEKIKAKIPKSIEILDEKKFIKNTISDSLHDLIEDYSVSKNLDYSNRKIKRLSSQVLDIQNQISVTTKIQHVKIKYSGSYDEFIFVIKSIELPDGEYDTILEQIPSDISVNFISDVDKLNDNLYEVTSSSDELEIVYYSKGNYIEDLEDAMSILFYDFPSTGITGFFSFSGNGSSGSHGYFVIAFVVFGLVGGLFLTRNSWVFDSRTWDKDGEVRKVVYFIGDSNSALKKEDFDRARNNYREMKSRYSSLPKNFKKLIRGRIENIRVALDKIEIVNLVKEYEAMKRLGKNELSSSLYEKIQSKYKRLPKKYQNKVYKRLFAN